jgi:hypothetical protein
MVRNTEAPRVYATSRELESEMASDLGEERVKRYREMANTVEGRQFLAKTMKESHPELNGDAEHVAAERDLNYGEARRKESWAAYLVKAPFRAAGWTLRETFGKRPILSTAALLALLYFTGGGSSLLVMLQRWISKAPDMKVAEIAGSVLPAAAPAGALNVGPGIGTLPFQPVPGLSAGPNMNPITTVPFTK